MTSPPIVCKGLTRSFKGDLAVDGVDLEVRGGEIHAIVGLNGAGKTTLMRLMLGMLNPEAGHTKIFGLAVSAATRQEWTRVGHLIETPFAYPELTVTENLMSAALLHGMDPSRIAVSVDRLIEAFDLSRWAGRRARVLSSGTRHRLGLASAMIHGPSVLILDEPATALDAAGVVFIRDLLRTFVEENTRARLKPFRFDTVGDSMVAVLCHSPTSFSGALGDLMVQTEDNGQRVRIVVDPN